MKFYKQLKKYGSRALVGASAMGSSAMALAIDTTATQTAITGATGDATTVGEQVIAGVAILLVIGLVIGVLHKLR